ncbi:hypothetical protein E3U43_008625 [Larimichthys crocea]|uniref:Uncharacterized protein n=1 Tax=Larimichthys crocea TaxID=215358 RepID=A0ACD3RVY4_LARCR|nr:hypothetical protein E3U43_008625 [Larimichthys crocea]
MHWLGDPKQKKKQKTKKRVVVNGEVQVEKGRPPPPYLRIFPRTSPPGAWSHLTPILTPPRPRTSSHMQGPDRENAAAARPLCASPHSRRFIHSALSLFFISDWPIKVTPCDGVTYMH